MKLIYSPTSPFARKVLIVAIERGLDEAIERVVADPWAGDSEVPEYGPLGKVPVLETPDAGRLFDSPVICEYLDAQHVGEPVFPASGPARWRALRAQALGDGILDAAVAWRLEKMRPESGRSAAWIERQLAAIRRALAALEAQPPRADAGLTIGDIATAVALGYLDFRVAEEDWRATHPRLESWFSDWAGRDSMRATEPPET